MHRQREKGASLMSRTLILNNVNETNSDVKLDLLRVDGFRADIKSLSTSSSRLMLALINPAIKRRRDDAAAAATLGSQECRGNAATITVRSFVPCLLSCACHGLKNRNNPKLAVRIGGRPITIRNVRTRRDVAEYIAGSCNYIPRPLREKFGTWGGERKKERERELLSESHLACTPRADD